MTRIEKIEELIKQAAKLQKTVKSLISGLKDYDLERILKKVDAELMDAQHNLGLIKAKLEEKRKAK